MATELIDVLRRKLAAYEGAGMVDQAKAVKAKLAVVEKAAAKAAPKAADPELEAADEPSKKTKKEST